MDDRTRRWMWGMMPVLAPGFALAMLVFGLVLIVDCLTHKVKYGKETNSDNSADEAAYHLERRRLQGNDANDVRKEVLAQR